jgi:L-asparaginase/Glu-tRNA(Gln) amidotransferase subunit D
VTIDAMLAAVPGIKDLANLKGAMTTYRAMSVVASDELNLQKFRVLLMLALLRPRSREEIQNLFSHH